MKKRTIIFLLVFGTFLILLLRAPSFLSMQDPVQANILVVERWAASRDYVITAAVQEFKSGAYTHILIRTTLPPDTSSGRYNDDFVDDVKDQLCLAGIDKNDITVVMAPYVKRHKTMSMAVALRIFIGQHFPNREIAVNVLTLGFHGRKSLIIFREILGKQIPVGVISVRPREFDANRWFLSRSGTKKFIISLINFFYAWVWSL